ncbi:hypothetical protein [Micromonospora sp. WMMD712]|uniref:hypothetical protein n=1 Tax=Micromonospora sp. WMMD712 TaxID=3016096 RepID=UPI00249B2074|nr:hypothetical protein [Micromonospora sp. WMMD712]WFE61230.1 hypothetical protein O7633_32215 [Micromonospora sp. WMMD712]
MTLPSALHRVLLRVAGHAPAPLLSAARGWLATGEAAEAARALAFAALARQVHLTDADALLLTGALAAAGGPADLLADVPRSGRDDPPPYALTPTRPAAGPADPAGGAGPDRVDRAAVAAVAGVDGSAGPTGLWRVWRHPVMATPYPPAKRVYLAQDRAGAVALAGRIQAALVAAGEHDPLVEVFADAADLPSYQRRALRRAVLLWAARPAGPVRIAATFDALDAAGNPAFAADRPRLPAAEADRVAGYLAAGCCLVASPVRVPDVIEPTRRVPTDLRADGRWIWSAAAGHYLTRYRIAPDPGLLATIRAADYTVPDVDAVAVHRARAALAGAAGGPDGPASLRRVGDGAAGDE